MRQYHLIDLAFILVLSFFFLGCTTAAPADTSSVSPDAVGLTDSGFRPQTNGFSFENYGDNIKAVDLTPEEMRQMFGDKVCASTADGKCVLTHPAKRWMDEAIAAMESGHCEGMAVLSNLIYCGLISPVNLGGDAAINLSIENEGLQRAIGRWWSTQLTSPGSSNRIYKSPNAVLDALAEAFKDGKNAEEWWAMGIYMPDGTGGHAITPFAVEDMGNGTSRILVYDNNWPGEIRSVEVDTKANTWRYQASVNPNEPSTLYTGNATTMNLEIVSISPRLELQDCDFCDDSNDTVLNNSQGIAPKNKRVQVWQDGKAKSLVTDKLGRRVGFLESGQPVNEIPDAEIRNLKLAANNTHLPVIFVPVESGTKPDLKVTVSSAMTGEEMNEANTTILAPGLAVAFSNPDLAAGQEQNINLTPAADGYAVTFTTNQEVSPTISIDTDLQQTSISGTSIEPGGNVSIEMNQTDNSLTMTTNGNTSSEATNISVTSINETSGNYSTFRSTGISLEQNDEISLSFAGSDSGMSMPSLSIDRGDGVIETARLVAVSPADQFIGSGFDSVIPDITAPGIISPNMSTPGINIPDTSGLDLIGPDMRTPGLNASGIISPDISSPGAGNLGIISPDITNPGISSPDISNPGTGRSDVSNPGISSPDISNPDIRRPGGISPETNNSGITNPGTAEPSISNPDISNPGISTPDISNPGISTPGISDPDISGPV